MSVWIFCKSAAKWDHQLEQHVLKSWTSTQCVCIDWLCTACTVDLMIASLYIHSDVQLVPNLPLLACMHYRVHMPTKTCCIGSQCNCSENLCYKGYRGAKECRNLHWMLSDEREHPLEMKLHATDNFIHSNCSSTPFHQSLSHLFLLNICFKIISLHTGTLENSDNS